jgi:hypothetical protein
MLVNRKPLGICAALLFLTLSSMAFATSYSITASPSSSSIKVGDCLYFTGRVTLNGLPAVGIQIGVQDPIRQQSVANVATTGANGNFTYYVESMCPAKYNAKVGSFYFTFFAGTNSVVSKVVVSPSSPSGLDELKAVNSGTSTYKVNLTVDGVNKGTYTVGPGSSINLLSSAKYNNSTVIATVYDSAGKTLWKATYTDMPYYTPLPAALLNPQYTNMYIKSTANINGTSKNWSYCGINQRYSNNVNQQWTAAGCKISAENVVDHWSGQGSGGVSGPGCSTFLGFKTRCSVSVGVSVGLQLCGGWGWGWALGPATVGGTAKCCVEVASVKCNVAEVSVQSSVTYKS